jgi:FG-GAP repeat
VIGALGAEGFVGRGYAFSRAQDGQWTQTAELQARQPAGQLDLGTSVSMSRDGSVVLAGANVYKDAVGAACVFRYANRRWTQRAVLTAGPQAQAGAYFGTSVALDATGSAAVVGAVYEGNGEGAACVFRRGTGGWNQAARLSEPGAQQFGDAVTVSDGGTIAAVGAEATQVTGTAYVYARSAGVWGQAMTLKPDVTDQALYGVAVSADADGGEVMVGAAFDDNGNPVFAGYGAVYVVPVQVTSPCPQPGC